MATGSSCAPHMPRQALVAGVALWHRLNRGLGLSPAVQLESSRPDACPTRAARGCGNVTGSWIRLFPTAGEGC